MPKPNKGVRRNGPQQDDWRYPDDALVAIPKESYGHKMRRLRLLLGMNQREVAEMIDVHPETISAWEQGKRAGASSESTEIPRRVITLLSARLRRKRQKDAGGDRAIRRLDSGSAGRGVGAEPMAPLLARRLRRA